MIVASICILLAVAVLTVTAYSIGYCQGWLKCHEQFTQPALTQWGEDIAHFQAELDALQENIADICSGLENHDNAPS